MTTLLKNKDGKVSLKGAVSFQMPTDRTALGMLSINKPIDGGVFKEDGWVYVDDKPVKKWFGSVWRDGIKPIRIWEPKLQDLKTLERKYQKVRERRDHFFENKYKPVREKLVKVGEAYVQQVTEDNSEKYWTRYTVEKDQRYGTVVGEEHLYRSLIKYDWPEYPVTPVNVDLGEEYHAVEDQLTRYNDYVYKFKNVLERAIYLYIDKHFKHITKDNVVLDISINGRSHWYSSYYTNGYNVCWRKLAWQEGEVIHHKI